MNWRLPALIVGILAVLFVALTLAKVNPIDVVTTLLKGSLGTPAAISATLRETTPLLILGLAVFLALRAGLFNIGAEGQFVVGALAGTAVILRIPGPAGIVLGMLFGALFGALWALPAGWIKAYRNGHEVITTIMLNNVAALMTTALVAGPFKDPKQGSPTTAVIDPSSRIPNLYSNPPVNLNATLLLGLLMALGLAYWLRKTVAGYELQAVGANSTAARFAGVDPRRVTLRAMSASGGIAGLAGALQVMAFEGRFYANFSPGYGFNALGVALLAGGNPLGVLPASFLFGMLEKGGTSMQISGVPKGLTTVLLGMLILIAAAIRYRRVRVVA